jgi:hypothetical protein
VEEVTDRRKWHTGYDSKQANMTFASFQNDKPLEIW